jgi:hypothetical protein
MQEMVTTYPEATPTGIAEALLLVYKDEKIKAYKFFLYARMRNKFIKTCG